MSSSKRTLFVRSDNGDMALWLTAPQFHAIRAEAGGEAWTAALDAGLFTVDRGVKSGETYMWVPAAAAEHLVSFIGLWADIHRDRAEDMPSRENAAVARVWTNIALLVGDAYDVDVCDVPAVVRRFRATGGLYGVTVNVETDTGTGWHGSSGLPYFQVQANCEANAVRLAEDIVGAGRFDGVRFHICAVAL